MQNWLQQLQYRYRIYNPEIEPEHECDVYCNCPVHQYQRAKWARCNIQDAWNAAVIYPGESARLTRADWVGEKAYNGNTQFVTVFSGNPYLLKVPTPYGPFSQTWGVKQPSSTFHAMFITRTIALNDSLNRKAQLAIDEREPKGLWEVDEPVRGEKGKLKKFFSTESASKISEQRRKLRDDIVGEENGRWPDKEWRELVRTYQEKTGMTKKIAILRAVHPIQYLHLLRAGYFEPIPVAWAKQASNPLKFSIEGAAGWRGITPQWRGYEDTAEERLYWVLNHREGSMGTAMKPDFISALEMARERMSRAVPPPPEYYDSKDTCHIQHKTDGYSKQVLPPPFVGYDGVETSKDDTMILLDVSGSMDFEPQSPVYEKYLITGMRPSTQPKNKGESSCRVGHRIRLMIRCGQGDYTSFHRCYDKP